MRIPPLLALLLFFAPPAWGLARHEITATLDPATRWLSVLDVLTVEGGRVDLAPAAGLR
ncbi:MAG: hypothetical protein HQL38_11160, partial [Alphaproteobacteria bacterium]|nr:hypothetical protein [Alphaproteobacteria bacterium]